MVIGLDGLALTIFLGFICTHLKRIADALENSKLPGQIESAITTGMTEGANNAIYWWRQSR